MSSPKAIDIRIETPRTWEWIPQLPGLTSINLNPPASGPEIELTFEQADGVVLDETFLKGRVEVAARSPVLASRSRDN